MAFTESEKVSIQPVKSSLYLHKPRSLSWKLWVQNPLFFSLSPHTPAGSSAATQAPAGVWEKRSFWWLKK